MNLWWRWCDRDAWKVRVTGFGGKRRGRGVYIESHGVVGSIRDYDLLHAQSCFCKRFLVTKIATVHTNVDYKSPSSVCTVF